VQHECIAEERLDARAPTTRLQAMQRAPVVRQRERDVAVRERDAPERLVAMPPFGRFRAQELAPRRRIEIKLLDGDRRAAGKRRGRDRADGSAFDLDAPRMRPVESTRGDGHARHGGDRRERLAAKPECADRLEVDDRPRSSTSRAGDGERQIVALDAAAVVRDADALDAAARDVDVDLRCVARRARSRAAP
jgi:hypothetical protein